MPTAQPLSCSLNHCRRFCHKRPVVFPAVTTSSVWIQLLHLLPKATLSLAALLLSSLCGWLLAIAPTPVSWTVPGSPPHALLSTLTSSPPAVSVQCVPLCPACSSHSAEVHYSELREQFLSVGFYGKEVFENLKGKKSGWEWGTRKTNVFTSLFNLEHVAKEQLLLEYSSAVKMRHRNSSEVQLITLL